MIQALGSTMGVVSEATKLVGIDRATHYKWLNSDDDYKAAVEDSADVAIDFAETALKGQIEQGNITAIIFYLKTKGKKRGYIERQEIHHGGSIESTLIEWKPAVEK